MIEDLPALVICFAIAMYGILGMNVARARVKYGIAAPAVSGHPAFERVFRAHQNTMESMVAFVPSLWLFAQYVSPIWAAGIGLVWIAARIWYAARYYAEAAKRGPAAFGLSSLALGVLLIGAMIGIGASFVGG